MYKNEKISDKKIQTKSVNRRRTNSRRLQFAKTNTISLINQTKEYALLLLLYVD